MKEEFTNEQLENISVQLPGFPECGRGVSYNELIAYKSWKDKHKRELKQRGEIACDLAAALLEERKEVIQLREQNAFLKNQIATLDQIMTDNIKENNGPNRLNIDGVWHEGPAVDAYFRMLRVMQKAFSLILGRVS